MIRAILFDAVGTLIHLPRGAGWHYREIAARHGLKLEEAELGRAFRVAFREAAPRVAMAGPRPDDDKGWWRALVRRVLAECGAAPGEGAFEAMFEELYAHFEEPGVWSLYPEAMGVLKVLRGKYRLGLVSNWDRRLYRVLEDLGLNGYFGTIVLSSETGVDKPDPRIFEVALKALSVTPAETVHVGDDPEQDWRAAEAVGLHVYKVERPGRTLEGLASYVSGL